MTSVSGSGERLLAILGLFSEDHSEWTPEDMMQALGFSRPTLYRYLQTLQDAGYPVSRPPSPWPLLPPPRLPRPQPWPQAGPRCGLAGQRT